MQKQKTNKQQLKSTNEDIMKKHKKQNDSEPIIPSVNDLLRPNEEMVHTFRPHILSYVVSQCIMISPMVIIWLIVDILIIRFFLNNTLLDNIAIVLALFAIFAFILFPIIKWLIGLLKEIARYKHIEYGITNRRLIIKTGPLIEYVTSIDLLSIHTLNARVNHLENLLNVGDIYITTEDEDENAVMVDVKNPNAIMQKISETAHNTSIKIKHNLHDITETSNTNN
jgi:membrane protein YdbS with pleckstrin-like domain